MKCTRDFQRQLGRAKEGRAGVDGRPSEHKEGVSPVTQGKTEGAGEEGASACRAGWQGGYTRGGLRGVLQWAEAAALWPAPRAHSPVA